MEKNFENTKKEKLENIDIKEFAKFLFEEKIIKFGEFKLSSGKESPYYIDLKTLPSFPKYFKFVINTLEKKIYEAEIKFDYLCSIPTSSLIYSGALLYKLEKPVVYVRKESKGYGTNKLIEGYLRHGSEVLVVDDVATTGKSVINAIKSIRANGGLVSNTLVVIDRLEGAKESLKEYKVDLLSITTIKEIAEILHNDGLIDGNTLAKIEEQIAKN